MPNSLSHVTFPDLTEIVGTHYSSMLDSLDGWTQTTVGAGIITFSPDFTQLLGGPTAGDLAQLIKGLTYTPQDFSFGAKTILRLKAHIAIDANDDDLTLICVGDSEFNASNFGLRFKSYKVQGFSGNGTNQSNVDLITDVDPPWQRILLIKIILFPGIRLEFWIDNVLLGTKSNHLPLTDEFFGRILTLQTGKADVLATMLKFSAFDFYTIP